MKKQEWLINIFMGVTGADYETALDYLEGENWDYEDALFSYRADRK